MWVGAPWRNVDRAVPSALPLGCRAGKTEFAELLTPLPRTAAPLDQRWGQPQGWSALGSLLSETAAAGLRCRQEGCRHGRLHLAVPGGRMLVHVTRLCVRQPSVQCIPDTMGTSVVLHGLWAQGPAPWWQWRCAGAWPGAPSLLLVPHRPAPWHGLRFLPRMPPLPVSADEIPNVFLIFKKYVGAFPFGPSHL